MNMIGARKPAARPVPNNLRDAAHRIVEIPPNGLRPQRPCAVPNDDPELIAFLCAAVNDGGLPPSLADYLRDREDSRADLILELLSAVPVIPHCTVAEGQGYVLATTPQLYVELLYEQVFISPYFETTLWHLLDAHDSVAVTIRLRAGRSSESITIAFREGITQTTLSLFETTATDLHAQRTDRYAVRAGRLARCVRRDGACAVPSLCEIIRDEPELRDSVLCALAGDRSLLRAVHDHIAVGA